MYILKLRRHNCLQFSHIANKILTEISRQNKIRVANFFLERSTILWWNKISNLARPPLPYRHSPYFLRCYASSDSNRILKTKIKVTSGSLFKKKMLTRPQDCYHDMKLTFTCYEHEISKTDAAKKQSKNISQKSLTEMLWPEIKSRRKLHLKFQIGPPPLYQRLSRAPALEDPLWRWVGRPLVWLGPLMLEGSLWCWGPWCWKTPCGVGVPDVERPLLWLGPCAGRPLVVLGPLVLDDPLWCWGLWCGRPLVVLGPLMLEDEAEKLLVWFLDTVAAIRIRHTFLFRGIFHNV
jgi:hypothetical protein